MKKRVMVTAVALVATLLLSGCFGLNGIEFSDTALKPGPAKKSETEATLSAAPILTDKERDDVPVAVPRKNWIFVLVDLPPDGVLDVKPGKFDLKAKFANDPVQLAPDGDLEDYFAGGNCGSLTVTSDPSRLVVFRTQKRVADDARVGVSALTKLTFRQEAVSEDPTDPLSIAMGVWTDENDDGVVDDGEVACLGSASPQLAIKSNGFEPRAARQALRERNG